MSPVPSPILRDFAARWIKRAPHQRFAPAATVVCRARIFAALVLLLGAPALGMPTAWAAELPKVLMETSMGTITIELESERAPRSVENFLDYVDSGFYDGTVFHRVIEGFMVQGGGFTENYMRKQTRAPVRNEADNGLSNKTYTIAMARTNEPHSATAQFFINTVDNNNLDFTAATARGWGYTVFGRVIDGFDVVTKISETSTGSNGPFRRDAPKEAILITHASRVVPPSTDAVTPAPASDTDDAEAGTATTN